MIDLSRQLAYNSKTNPPSFRYQPAPEMIQNRESEGPRTIKTQLQIDTAPETDPRLIVDSNSTSTTQKLSKNMKITIFAKVVNFDQKWHFWSKPPILTKSNRIVQFIYWKQLHHTTTQTTNFMKISFSRNPWSRFHQIHENHENVIFDQSVQFIYWKQLNSNILKTRKHQN